MVLEQDARPAGATGTVGRCRNRDSRPFAHGTRGPQRLGRADQAGVRSGSAWLSVVPRRPALLEGTTGFGGPVARPPTCPPEDRPSTWQGTILTRFALNGYTWPGTLQPRRKSKILFGTPRFKLPSFRFFGFRISDSGYAVDSCAFRSVSPALSWVSRTGPRLIAWLSKR